MSGRSLGVLARLPRHFDAARLREDGSPAHLLGAIVDAVAGDLDELSTDLGKVRRAHRIGHAETLRDVMALAGLHGMRGELFAPLWQRLGHVLAKAAALGSGDDAARRTAAEVLLAPWGLALDTVLATGQHPLALWAQPRSDGSFDVADAAARLALHAAYAFSHRARLDLARERVVQVAAIHARGNGTVDALMRAAAAALDLELDVARNRTVKAALIARNAASIHPGLVSDDFLHSRDRYWHVSYASDRVRLSRPVLLPLPPPPPPPATPPAPPAVDTTPLARRRDLVILDDPHDRISVGRLARQLGLPLAELLARANAARPSGPPVGAASILDAAFAAALADAAGRDTIQILPAAEELLAIEENPVRRQPPPDVHAEVHAPHAHRFAVVRRGFGDALLRVEITGVGTSTVGPMLSNRDAGRGIGYTGTVPAGKILSFAEEGRVRLDGADVTSLAYSWRGGCFADAGDLRPGHDFVFATSTASSGKKLARFAVTEPPGTPTALDREAIYPTAGNPIQTPPIGVSETRFAYFVQVAHFGTERAGGVPSETVTPRYGAGVFASATSASTFAATPVTGGPEAGVIALSWLEHEAYAARVLIPSRFQLLDDGVAAGETIAERVQAAVDRVRPVGVEVRVEYLDERWRLDEGLLPGAEDDPVSRVTGGTVLWPVDT